MNRREDEEKKKKRRRKRKAEERGKKRKSGTAFFFFWKIPNGQPALVPIGKSCPAASTRHYSAQSFTALQ